MPKAASLRNLRSWKPGQSGNRNGRPRAPRFTERDQHVILTALAGAFGEGTQRAAIKAMRAVLANPRTVLNALELCARLNGNSTRRTGCRLSRDPDPGSRRSVLTNPRTVPRDPGARHRVPGGG